MKQVEFRRRPLGRQATHIVIYATAPVCAVVGVARIYRVECGSPKALWEQFSAIGGIDRQRFFGYFSGVAEGFAFVLRDALICDSPLVLGRSGLPARPPQAFQYIHDAVLSAVLKQSSPAKGSSAHSATRRALSAETGEIAWP